MDTKGKKCKTKKNEMHARISWSIKRCREKQRRQMKLSRNKAKTQEERLDRSTKCLEAIEEAGDFSIDPPGIEELSGLRYEKAWEAQQIVRCWGGVKPLFKTSFSRQEKHRHECNPTCNSTNDPINTIVSQNHLSIKILSTRISNTHTHTHTKQA